MSGSRPVVGMLVEALERIKLGDYNVTMEWSDESLQREIATIKAIAGRALAAFRERRPLAEDAELRAKVASWLVVDDQCDDIIDHACDIFDEHVLGSPAPQGGRHG